VADDIAPSTAVASATGSTGTPPAASGAPAASTSDQLAALSDEERAILVKVAEIVRKIQFGTVVLVIQDATVVQIEMAEKFRLR
jgi:hypothetical protein